MNQLNIFCWGWEPFDTCYCSSIYIHKCVHMAPSSLSSPFNCLQPFHLLYVFFPTLSHVLHVRFDAWGRNSIVYTCRFFYGLKFCASKGDVTQTFSLSLSPSFSSSSSSTSSYCTVYVCSTDGMSNENSLFFCLLPFAI